MHAVGTITIWVHWDFPFGLVAGDLVCSALSAAEDDLRKNDRTLTIPLEIPVNVTGVSAVRNTAISLFLMDNDGKCHTIYHVVYTITRG